MIKLLSLFLAFSLLQPPARSEMPASPSKAHLEETISSAGKYSLGSEEAPITIVMYYSLTCAHCRDFNQKIFPSILENFIKKDKVKWVIHDFPTDNVALKAAQVAWCKGPSHYQELSHTLLEHQNEWSFSPDWKDKLWQISHKEGISREEFDRALANENSEGSIIGHCHEAKKTHKIDFAPAFVVYTPSSKEGKLFEGEMTLEAVEKIVLSEETSHVSHKY